MNLGLNSKVAVIAGSSKGLGFATAKVLLQEGASVVINGRSIGSLDAALKSLEKFKNVCAVSGDVTIKDDCENLLKKAIDSFGKLDILITNCGGPPPGSFETLSESEWKNAVDKSFISHIYLIQSGLEYLKKSPNPCILTVTSFTVKQPMPNLILSNSIRAATVGLTKSLVFELGKYGIRVNSILPGWTLTSRVEDLLQNRAKLNQTSISDEKEKITDKIPLSRMADPEEFGRSAAFLVSPAASYINGVMLNVDGGIYQGLL